MVEATRQKRRLTDAPEHWRRPEGKWPDQEAEPSPQIRLQRAASTVSKADDAWGAAGPGTQELNIPARD